MLQRTNLIAVAGFATMLVFAQACAEPSKPKDTKKDQQVGIADEQKTPQDSQKDVPLQAKDNNAPLDMKKLSEAFGHFIGRNLNSPGVKFDLESIITGMRNGAAGKPAPMTDQEYEVQMVQVQEQAFKQLADDNMKAANEFLTKNAKEAKVIEVEPGKLQYMILEEGKGPAVTATSVPQIEYTGKYIDGTVFGSSEQSGGPISIPLDQTIPGFSKGILNMKEGEKRRLFVHPDLGYGTSGQLPPNSLLIFDIQVIKATTPKDPKQSSARDADLLPLAMEDMMEDDDDDVDDSVKKKPSDASPTTTQAPPSGK